MKVRVGLSHAGAGRLAATSLAINLLVVSVSFLILPGCVAGTVLTRGDQALVGGYPFAAVATDIAMVSHANDPPKDTSGIIVDGGSIAGLGLISVPLDLVIDVIASPFDLIFWCFGVHKKIQ